MNYKVGVLTWLVSACRDEVPSECVLEACLVFATANLGQVKAPQVLQLTLVDVVTAEDKQT